MSQHHTRHQNSKVHGRGLSWKGQLSQDEFLISMKRYGIKEQVWCLMQLQMELGTQWKIPKKFLNQNDF